jgi:hypothetical protein
MPIYDRNGSAPSHAADEKQANPASPGLLPATASRFAGEMVELAWRVGSAALPVRVQLRGAEIVVTVSIEANVPTAEGQGTQPVSATSDPAGARCTVQADRVATTPTVPAGVRLRQVHRRLIDAATPQPTPAKQLSSRAGFRRCGSYVRQALTELARWGLLIRTPDGYRLP